MKKTASTSKIQQNLFGSEPILPPITTPTRRYFNDEMYVSLRGDGYKTVEEGQRTDPLNLHLKK